MSSNAPGFTPGVEVKELLESAAYDVEFHDPRTGPGLDEATTKHGIETSPLLLVDDEPINGDDDLKRWLARNAH